MAYTSIIEGVRGTGAELAAAVKPDVENLLYVLKPYQTPLMQWLWFYSRPAKVVNNAYGKFSWFENEFLPHQTTVAGAGITGGAVTETNIGVADSTIFNDGDILFVEATEDMLYVTSTDGGEIDVASMDGSTNISAASSGYIKIIGSRNTEYDNVREAMTTKEIEKYNYLNIFSESIKTSGRQEAGEHYTDGLTHDELVEKRIEEMKLQIERYFMFAPQQGYATSGNYRTTWGHGIIGRVQTNVNTYSGALTETAFDEHLKEVFARGSNRKIHICGSDQLQDINSFIKSRYELNPETTVNMYGINVNEYITPFGLVDVIWNPVMDGKFADWGFTLDADHIRMRYMAPDKKGARKFRLEEGVETPGVDGTTTKILFDVGLELTNEETCGILHQV